MAAVLKVSTAELERTSGEYNKLHEEVSRVTDDMITLIKALHTVYTGEAADALVTKALSLDNDMNQIKLMIKGHERELLEIAGIMNKADTDSLQDINSLPSDVI